MKKTVIILFFIFSLSASNKPLPQYIKTCRRNDPNLNECFARNANLAISYIAKGDPDYDIKPLFPLKWKKFLEFETPGLKFCLLDIDVYGAENLRVIEPNINLRKNLIQFNFSSPLIIWKGNYNALVEENGETVFKNGHVEFHFSKGKYLMTFEYKLHDIYGIKYAKLTKFKEDILANELDLKPNSDPNGLSSNDWIKLKPNVLTTDILDNAASTIGDYIDKIFNVVPFHIIFP